jgi:hypothetical protein
VEDPGPDHWARATAAPARSADQLFRTGPPANPVEQLKMAEAHSSDRPRANAEAMRSHGATAFERPISKLDQLRYFGLHNKSPEAFPLVRGTLALQVGALCAPPPPKRQRVPRVWVCNFPPYRARQGRARSKLCDRKRVDERNPRRPCSYPWGVMTWGDRRGPDPQH